MYGGSSQEPFLRIMTLTVPKSVVATSIIAPLTAAGTASAQTEDALEERGEQAQDEGMDMRTRMEELEERITGMEQVAPSGMEPADFEFRFAASARSGILFGENGSGTEGGPYYTPAGTVGGAVGRLGIEDDTYAEEVFSALRTHDCAPMTTGRARCTPSCTATGTRS